MLRFIAGRWALWSTAKQRSQPIVQIGRLGECTPAAKGKKAIESRRQTDRKNQTSQSGESAFAGMSEGDMGNEVEFMIRNTGAHSGPSPSSASGRRASRRGGSAEFAAGADGEDNFQPMIREIELPSGKAQTSAAWNMEAAAMPKVPTPSIERLLACRSAGEVLATCAKRLEEVRESRGELSTSLGELALAVQLLGQWSSGYQKAALRDKRLAASLSALAEHAPVLEPWALVSTFRGVARIASLSSGGATAAAASSAAKSLIEAASERLPELDVAQVALLLRSLVGGGPELRSSKAGAGLRDGLVAMLELRAQELEPVTAALLVPALVKLRSSGGAQLAGAISKRVTEGARNLKAVDVAAAAHGLAALRVTSPRLLEQTEKVLQQQVHLCTPRSVVQFAAALSEGRAEPESFRDFLMPVARSFILDFGPRDLCTLAEAFCKASVADPDFLADLAQSLEPKVGNMGPHEVSVALSVFAPVAYAVPNLLPAVADQTKGLVD
ncbi:unnamed protein product, partial [Polarella glacialis]